MMIQHFYGSGALPVMPISAYSALSVPAYRRAVQFLSDQLASLPRSIRRDGHKLPTPHPLTKLLRRRPNNYCSAHEMFRTFALHAVHRGNGYLRIERDPRGRPIGLHLLPVDEVVVIRLEQTPGVVETWYGWTKRRAPDGGPMALPFADVIHVRNLSYDSMIGEDPTMLHGTSLQHAAMIQRYSFEFLRKGTVIRGAVEFPGPLAPELMAKVRAMLTQFQSPDAPGDVLILDSGASLKNVSLTPQQSQLVEQTAASTKAIAQITGVDPQFLFERSESKYNNSASEAGESLVKYTLRPWIEQIEHELSTKLLTDAELDDGLHVHLNPDALLRGNFPAQVTALRNAVDGRIATPNEARALLGFPRLEDPEADKIKMPGDTSPTPAAPAADPPSDDE